MAVLKVSSSLRKYIFSSGENRFKSKVKEDQYLINLRKLKRQFGFITTIVYYCLGEFKLKIFFLWYCSSFLNFSLLFILL